MTKKIVSRIIEDLSYLSDIPIADVASHITALAIQHPDCRIQFEWANLIGDRLETDEEYADRMAYLAEEEREEFEYFKKLSAKYAGISFV